MTPDEQGRDEQAETARAGEGTWTQGSATPAAEEDALGRDPADTAGHTRTESGELISDTVRPEDKGHGDGEVEQREDQLTGPGGVQRDREADRPAVYDPVEGGVPDNPSDPADYPNPDDQRAGSSRFEPGLPDGGRDT